jgi:peptidyl-prolyl cis-trans isomerase-like 2
VVDGKVLGEFDHVKKGLKLEDEGLLFASYSSTLFQLFSYLSYIVGLCDYFSELQRMKDDPTYNINISGDLKQMIKELGTEKGKEAFLQGGGGRKAQKESCCTSCFISKKREG